MGYEPGTTNMPQPIEDAESTTVTDENGKLIVDFCLWCNKMFYTFEEAEAHNADGSAACPVVQKYKDEGLLNADADALSRRTRNEQHQRLGRR
jgi:hypothetical protein